jgi:KUP system potassium uptake protein
MSAPDQPAPTARAALALAALGVVYGDIGTSPLYAIRECFHGEFGVQPTPDAVLGVLSLLFWTLNLIVTFKYLTVILRADNDGEGGVVILGSLVDGAKLPRRLRTTLLMMTLFAAALLYGDGMITPAISVLSAVEGLQVVTPVFLPYVLPLTAAILIALFTLQRRGTAGIGVLFGPVTLVWCLVLAALGIRSVIAEPRILAAVNPWWAVKLLKEQPLAGFLVLGAVFLVVTGAEALYADLGHFGTFPIRAAWLAVVLPSLVCNYFGQGALLLRDPAAAANPFYALAPDWGLVPLVILATAAAIIASQAVITGAFSLTRQLIQMGYWPRLQIIHTSATQEGQIYLPAVNRLLMVATLLLVFSFRSSGALAAAYGVAVTSTMVITTVLFYFVARTRWRWNRLAAGSLALVFLLVDLAFFGANATKILHGAWLPLAIAAVAFVAMTSWRTGRRALAQESKTRTPLLEDFIRQQQNDPPPRVAGTAVFLSSDSELAPAALLHNLAHNHVLHERIVCLTIRGEETPRVPPKQRVDVEELGFGFLRITGHYGFMEYPNVPKVLQAARNLGCDLGAEKPSFFLGRERLLSASHPALPRWRRWIFSAMTRNAAGATAFFKLPPEQVVELGAQVEI